MRAVVATLHVVRTDPISAALAARRLRRDPWPSGVVLAQPMATATLTVPTPWRYVVLCAWADGDDVRPLDVGGHPRPPVLTLWPRQVHGTWRGVHFDAQPSHDPGEEVAAFVYGRLRGRHAVRFARRNATVARTARRSAGFLHGMGLFESPLRFASFSRWRTADDLQRFAYGPGTHRGVIRPYRETPWATDHASIRFAVSRRPGPGS